MSNFHHEIKCFHGYYLLTSMQCTNTSAALSDQFCTIEALLRSRKRLALLRTKIVKSGLLRKTLRLKALISYHSITDKVCRRTFNLKVRKQDYPDEGTNHIL